jgi:hypothetical protein
MARLFDQVEHLLERVLETPGRLLFRTRLEPVELARAIGRAMESSGLVGANGLVVPNSYRVELHPADFEPFAPWLQGLQQDLARFVGQRASGRGWVCAGKPIVQVVSVPTGTRGRPHVVAATVDTTDGAGSAPSGAATPALERTAVLAPKPAPPPAAGTARAGGWLELHNGHKVQLRPSVTRLGRAPDNDVVLADPSVSRYHAQIKVVAGDYRLVDLASHNGTRIDTTPVGDQVLRPGQTIYLGALPIRFFTTP